jgi:peptide/nickel transport system substrate-binding protein
MMTRNTKRRGGAMAARMAAAAALLLAGCGGSSDGDDAGDDDVSDVTTASEGPVQEGGTLVVGLSSESSGWSPVTSPWLYPGLQVAGAIFDPLAAVDADGNVQPYLAESFEANDDYTVWTIGVRPGVTFHDGTPVDADAIRMNLEAHRASGFTGQAFGPVESVEVVDDSVVVRMREPWSTFPSYLTAQPGYVAAPSMLSAPDGARNPVGSGPFVFEEWVPDAHLVVRANEDYWQEGLPRLDGIRFLVLPDDTARNQALLLGDVEMIDVTLPAEILEMQARAADGEVQLFIDDTGDSDEIGVALNTAEPPFDDPVARELVATGVDNQLLSDTVFEGLFAPARGPLRPESPYYVETDYPTYDPDRARELAAEYEARHGEPLSFSLKAPPDPAVLEVVQLTKELLGEFGVEVTIETPEEATMVVDATLGNFDAIGFLLFASPTTDGDYALLHSDNAKPVGELAVNVTRMQNSTIDEAFAVLRRTEDTEVWREQAAIVQREMAEDLAYLFSVHSVGAVAASPDVRDAISWTLPDGRPGIPQRGTVLNLNEVWLGR